jgi:hypothetical protein
MSAGSMTSVADIKQELMLFRTRLSSPDAALVDLFSHRLSRCCEDDSTVEELVTDLDRILGQVWFSSNEGHATVALIIARLRDTVAAIAGMTMNERLFAFDLMDRWDDASDAERDILYKKVLAKK